jgi:transcriptional regulator with XRE-family HTH domain
MDGNKIRQLRQEKKLTIEKFAEITDFTASYISQLERNKLEPSLTALTKISKALGVSLYYFLEENNKIIVTKKNERKTVSSENKADISFLTHIDEVSGLKPEFYIYEVVLEPNQWDSKTVNLLSCHKCIIVKKGTLLIEFNNSNEIMQAGDSVYIDSNLPHRCYNPTSSEVEFLCITSALDLS